MCHGGFLIGMDTRVDSNVEDAGCTPQFNMLGWLTFIHHTLAEICESIRRIHGSTRGSGISLVLVQQLQCSAKANSSVPAHASTTPSPLKITALCGSHQHPIKQETIITLTLINTYQREFVGRESDQIADNQSWMFHGFGCDWGSCKLR